MFVTEDYVFDSEHIDFPIILRQVYKHCCKLNGRSFYHELYSSANRLVILQFIADKLNEYGDNIIAPIHAIYSKLSQIHLQREYVYNSYHRYEYRTYLEDQNWYIENNDWITFRRNERLFLTRSEETFKNKKYRRFVRYASRMLRKNNIPRTVIYSEKYDAVLRIIYLKYKLDKCDLKQLNSYSSLGFYGGELSTRSRY